MQAQAMDLEAIENLRLAKEQAERRAQRLEEKLRQSTRSFGSEKRGTVELVLDEDASDDEMDDLGADQRGDQAENNALDMDLDDDLMAPPGYDDVQSVRIRIVCSRAQLKAADGSACCRMTFSARQSHLQSVIQAANGLICVLQVDIDAHTTECGSC